MVTRDILKHIERHSRVFVWLSGIAGGFLCLGYPSSNQRWPRKIDSIGWEQCRKEKVSVDAGHDFGGWLYSLCLNNICGHSTPYWPKWTKRLWAIFTGHTSLFIKKSLFSVTLVIYALSICLPKRQTFHCPQSPTSSNHCCLPIRLVEKLVWF